MHRLAPAFFALFLLSSLGAEPPLRSGLDVGQRPGPYAALVAVGAQRGTQHCYVCEAEDRPIVIVFARTPSEPLGKLVHRLDAALKQHASAEVRGWVTFLAPDALPLEPKVVAWSRKHATGGVPVAIFEDEVGPPAYRLSRDADVTVLLSVKQKVVANFAFRPGALNDEAVERVVQALPRIVRKG